VNNKIKINVIDSTTNKIVLEGTTMKLAADFLEVSYNAVQNAIKRESLVKYKYRFLINPNARR